LRRRRPAELALDLVDKLLDPARRRCRRLLLDAEQRRLVFIVAEPEVEAGIHQQNEADESDLTS